MACNESPYSAENANKSDIVAPETQYLMDKNGTSFP